MSDTAREDTNTASVETLTSDGEELDMAHGHAYQRTEDAVVWVDARCVGCQSVTVCTVRADAADWTTKKTFADICNRCSMITPHNIIAVLNGLNHERDRGRVPRGDGHGQ